MYNFGKNNRESNDLMFAVNSKVPTYFKVDIMHYLTGRLIKTQLSLKIWSVIWDRETEKKKVLHDNMLNVVPFLRLGLLIHSDELLYNHAKVRRNFRRYTVLSANHKTDKFTFKCTFTDFNICIFNNFIINPNNNNN